MRVTRTLVQAANEVGAKLILISTDWVFNGTQTGADEETPPNTVNYHGVLKVLCEAAVQESAQTGQWPAWLEPTESTGLDPIFPWRRTLVSGTWSWRSYSGFARESHSRSGRETQHGDHPQPVK